MPNFCYISNMEITYLGHSAFLLKSKSGTVVITDPYFESKMGKKMSITKADFVTISHDHDDHNATSELEGSPFVIQYPGEYEMEGIRFLGFDTFHDKSKGEERGRNTMFKIIIDDISILHCGDLGHTLKTERVEDIGDVDVLLVPVGGFYTIDPLEAADVTAKLEPSIVIPMHYNNSLFSADVMDKLQPVESFLKEIGAGDIQPVASFSVLKGDLGEDMKTVLLSVT